MRAILYGAMMAAVGASAAAAQTAEPGQAAPQDEVVTSAEGVRYACTGVAQDSREDPRWSGFPLKIVFAAADGGYLADVRATVTDPSGRAVLDVTCGAPWLLLDVPAGTYRVAASVNGATETSEATVASGRQTEDVVRFDQVAGD